MSQTQIKSNLKFKSLAEDVKARVRQEEDLAEDQEWMEADEFRLRYRNVKIAALSAAFCALVSFIMIAFANTMQEFLLALLSMLVLKLFYVKLSFLLWASRQILETREVKFLRIGDYFAAVCADPRQLLPLPIAPKVKQ
ncbi:MULTISPECIES: hypothetical protein [Pseudomonas]|uniref:hypothetical protein n=1 Tax=Pseudomonas TaxID=286 RepID=UPI0012E7071F|nr:MULTISPECIES: hypothetical protein [Pseudomonas]MDT8924993.1 hypothetical protein [Pseudomonas taiwanensis]